MLIAVVSIFITLVVVVLVRNLSTLERQIEHRIQPDFSVGDKQFERVMGSMLGPGLRPGNRVVPLVNGKVYFPEMLEAIRSARDSVTLETFIFWSGRIGHAFADALIERADAGVKVHILLDWLGSWKMEQPQVSRLRASKVELRFFRAPGWHNLMLFNNRTHRKILVVDGRVAFTGGAGIADSWDGDAQDAQHWRDTQYRLEGPAVSQMQAAFMDNWVESSQEVLLCEEFFPPLEPAGEVLAQAFMSGPGSGSQSARLMYLVSISCACKSVRLGHGYFIPDRLSLDTLVAARRRGVEVEVIVQGPTDAPYTQRCSRYLWGELLKAGVKIYMYEKAMYHCKTMIVDDCWVSVGSANFDTRSFRLNDEINLNALDGRLARQIVETFEADKAESRLVSYEEWLSRSLYDKFMDRACSLLRAQM